MGLNLNAWDMHDVNEAMRDKTLFEIIGLYKEKENELKEQSMLYFKMKTIEVKEDIEKECEKLDREKCVIALRIADEMSKESGK